MKNNNSTKSFVIIFSFLLLFTSFQFNIPGSALVNNYKLSDQKTIDNNPPPFTINNGRELIYNTTALLFEDNDFRNVTQYDEQDDIEYEVGQFVEGVQFIFKLHDAIYDYDNDNDNGYDYGYGEEEIVEEPPKIKGFNGDISGSTFWSNFKIDVEYREIDSSLLNQTGSHALMYFVIPADVDYTSSAQNYINAGFNTTLNTASEFGVEYADSNQTLNVTWDKEFGVMTHYYSSVVNPSNSTENEIFGLDFSGFIDDDPPADEGLGDSEIGEIPNYTLVEQWGTGNTSDVEFSGPNAIAIDGEDNIYITEFMGNRVQKFNSDGELIIAWGSEGNNNGQFRNPTGITIDSEGNIYVSESGNSRVQKFTSDGEWLAIWGVQGSDDGQFNSAMVVIVVSVNNESQVFVSDWGNHRIQVFDTEGEFLMTWGERGSSPGQITTPTGLTVDSNGNIWVVDRGNSRVQSFTPGGELLSTWGSEGSNDGQFLTPTSIAIDKHGFIYVSEAGGTRVQILTAEGVYLATPVSTLNSPHGIAFDSTGAMYIADTMNGLVKKFELNSTTDSTTDVISNSFGFEGFSILVGLGCLVIYQRTKRIR